MGYFVTILLGVPSGVVASLIVLGYQRWRVWQEASKIAGEWCAYQPTEDGGWAPMHNDDEEKAGLTRIWKASFWRGPINHLHCEAETMKNEKPYPHSGEFLLDPPHCRHGIRTIQQDNPRPRYHVQEIWVLEKDVIRVETVSWDLDAPPQKLHVHLLVRKGSEKQKEFDKKLSGAEVAARSAEGAR